MDNMIKNINVTPTTAVTAVNSGFIGVGMYKIFNLETEFTALETKQMLIQKNLNILNIEFKRFLGSLFDDKNDETEINKIHKILEEQEKRIFFLESKLSENSKN
jgi:hypothetical protein